MNILPRLKFICRHIVRAPVKSMLTAFVAMFFILALGRVQEGIAHAERQIDYFYGATIVSAEMRRNNRNVAAGPLGNPHSALMINEVLDSGFVMDAYIEAVSAWGWVPHALEEESAVKSWYRLALWTTQAGAVSAHGRPPWYLYQTTMLARTILGLDRTPYRRLFNQLLAVNDLTGFVSHNSVGLAYGLPGVRRVMGDMAFEFAPGFGEEDFAYVPGRPVPVILTEQLLYDRGLSLGDETYLVLLVLGDWVQTWHARPVQVQTWYTKPAHVIASHNNNITNVSLQGSVLIPLEALEAFPGQENTYITFTFNINPAYNRDMRTVHIALTNAIRTLLPRPNVILQDEELRLVVGVLEQNLELLRLLYPVAVGLTVLIGLGISMLLVLQTAKNAAIIRVLGTRLAVTRCVLVAEQLLICMLGLALGFAVLMILGWGFGAASILELVGFYLAAAAIGTIAGAVLVTMKPPLELLQVRE